MLLNKYSDVTSNSNYTEVDLKAMAYQCHSWQALYGWLASLTQQAMAVYGLGSKWWLRAAKVKLGRAKLGNVQHWKVRDISSEKCIGVSYWRLMTPNQTPISHNLATIYSVTNRTISIMTAPRLQYKLRKRYETSSSLSVPFPCLTSRPESKPKPKLRAYAMA